MARKEKFNYFEYMSKIALNSHKAALKLHEIFADFDPTAFLAQAEAIHVLEREADEFVHAIMDELTVSFITPIDREDIATVTNAIDNVLDDINATTYLLENMNVQHIRPNAEKITEYIIEATSGVYTASKEFAKFKNSKTLRQMLKDVNNIESEADRLYSALTKDLFTNEKDPIEIIVWRDLLNRLEHTVDDTERAVDIINNMVIKNS